jgi:threonine/homoserine/homoserine lactone efflux protein
MVSGASLAVFIAASLVLIVTPGPDMLYVIARGIAQGRATAIVASLGISTGLLVHTTLAAFGLSVLLSRSAAAFMVAKYAGAAYLLYLGVRALRSKEGLLLPSGLSPVGPVVAYRQGFLSNVLNPKAALFVQAFLPQFVVPGRGHTAAQVLLLGLLLIVMGLAFHILVAFSAGRLGGWLRRQPRVNAWLRWLTGGTFIGLGLRLALPERR